MGNCSPYTEIQTFETSATSCRGTGLDLSNERFVQYVADNLDHNIGTFGGHDTFHGMGIIAALTPKLLASKSVPRINASTEDIVAATRVNIHIYRQSGNRMEETIDQHYSLKTPDHLLEDEMKYRKWMDLTNIDDVSEEF